MSFRRCLLLVAVVLVSGTSVQAADWIAAPSYYTHDPQSGEKTSQFAPVPDVYFQPDPTYQRSAYRHNRSSIRVNGSRDDFHIVEEWGRPVRPYGEWQRPYRPYSVPYMQWGPPFKGLGPIYGYPPYYPPVPPVPVPPVVP